MRAARPRSRRGQRRVERRPSPTRSRGRPPSAYVARSRAAQADGQRGEQRRRPARGPRRRGRGAPRGVLLDQQRPGRVGVGAVGVQAAQAGVRPGTTNGPTVAWPSDIRTTRCGVPVRTQRVEQLAVRLADADQGGDLRSGGSAGASRRAAYRHRGPATCWASASTQAVAEVTAEGGHGDRVRVPPGHRGGHLVAQPARQRRHVVAVRGPAGQVRDRDQREQEVARRPAGRRRSRTAIVAGSRCPRAAGRQEQPQTAADVRRCRGAARRGGGRGRPGAHRRRA